MTSLRYGIAATFRPWAPAEVATLRRLYPTTDARELAAKLDRSTRSVQQKAKALRVLKKRRWTATDDAQLRELWSELTLPALARRIGRTQATTYWRAQKLGLELGVTQGREYLTTAATRTGFETATLRKILSWAGVKLFPVMGRPTGARRHYHQVDAFDVDAAVEAWLETEPLACAAERRSIGADQLRYWLGLAGIRQPSKRKAKAHWRVKTADADRVVATFQKLRSVRSEAMRLGVDQHTLARWLKRAGVERVTVKPWLVDPEVCERVVARMRERKAA